MTFAELFPTLLIGSIALVAVAVWLDMSSEA